MAKKINFQARLKYPRHRIIFPMYHLLWEHSYAIASLYPVADRLILIFLDALAGGIIIQRTTPWEFFCAREDHL
jgi:hypothetical protein